MQQLPFWVPLLLGQLMIEVLMLKCSIVADVGLVQRQTETSATRGEYSFQLYELTQINKCACIVDNLTGIAQVGSSPHIS